MGHILTITSEADLIGAKQLLRTAEGLRDTFAQFMSINFGIRALQEDVGYEIILLREKITAYEAYHKAEREGIRSLSELCDYLLDRLLSTAWQGFEENPAGTEGALRNHDVGIGYLSRLIEHFGISLPDLFNPTAATTETVLTGAEEIVDIDTLVSSLVEETTAELPNGALSEQSMADLARHQGIISDLSGAPVIETVASPEVSGESETSSGEVGPNFLKIVLSGIVSFRRSAERDLEGVKYMRDAYLAVEEDLRDRIARKEAEKASEQPPTTDA